MLRAYCDSLLYLDDKPFKSAATIHHVIRGWKNT
jgi:hypothetical protein